MFSLRQNLTLGYLGLLAILLAVGLLAGVSLHRYRTTLERLFRENYDSVVYAQTMKAATQDLDALALADTVAPGCLDAAAARFADALAAESRNVTVPGEADCVRRLQTAWSAGAGRPSYVDALRTLTGDRPARLIRYDAEVRPRTAELLQAAQGVIDLNVRQMADADAQVQAGAARAARTLYALVAAGLAFGGVSLVLVARSVLRQHDAMRTALLSAVSHELKTPLTSLRLAAHLLADEKLGPLNAKQAELAAVARDDADRLHRTIDNLLDLGRLDAGHAGLDMRPARPEALVGQAVAEAQAAYDSAGVSLVATVPDDLPDVSVDADRLAHVFSNLLSNALKYTPPGGIVTVSARPDGDAAVRFEVRDTGPGIPADALPHVFDRFYRAAHQPTRRGVGLGLAIAREIVEAHGGHIRAQSPPGEGARMSFTLPATPGPRS